MIIFGSEGAGGHGPGRRSSFDGFFDLSVVSYGKARAKTEIRSTRFRCLVRRAVRLYFQAFRTYYTHNAFPGVNSTAVKLRNLFPRDYVGIPRKQKNDDEVNAMCLTWPKLLTNPRPAELGRSTAVSAYIKFEP